MQGNENEITMKMKNIYEVNFLNIFFKMLNFSLKN